MYWIGFDDKDKYFNRETEFHTPLILLFRLMILLYERSIFCNNEVRSNVVDLILEMLLLERFNSFKNGLSITVGSVSILAPETYNFLTLFGSPNNTE